MESQVKIIGDRYKIIVSIGIVLALLIITLALIFRFEFSLILISISGVIFVSGIVVAYNRLANGRLERKIKHIEIERERQLLRQETYKADGMHFQRYVLSFSKNERIVFPPNYRVQTIEPVTSSSPTLLPESTDTTEIPSLMDVIGSEPAVMFCGAKRSGKTNSAMYWLSQRGSAIVIDPKNEGATINHWSPNCQVVSSKDEIERAISLVISEMHRRRKESLLNEPSLTLFFDEIHDLIRRLEIDVIGSALDICTLGSEFKVYSSFTSHADTAKYLQLDAVALLENFTLCRTLKVGDIYRCFVDVGNGEFEVKPPGAYIPIQQSEQQITILSEDEVIKQAIEDNPGVSYNEIKRLANISGSRPTARAKIKDVIERYSLDDYKIGGKPIGK